MKRLRRRLCLLGAVALGAASLAPRVGRAEQTLRIPAFEPPVQHYAVVDVSGAKIGYGVGLIALDDTGQVAYTFDVAEPWSVHALTWKGGALGSEQITTYQESDPPPVPLSPNTGLILGYSSPPA